MVWFQVQQPKLDAFVHQPLHVLATEIVKMAYPASKANAKPVVMSIATVSAMNDVKVVFASHYVVVMTIVDMVKFVKTLFAQPDVDQMHIVQLI